MEVGMSRGGRGPNAPKRNASPDIASPDTGSPERANEAEATRASEWDLRPGWPETDEESDASELASARRAPQKRADQQALDRMNAGLTVSLAAFAMGQPRDEVAKHTRGRSRAALARQVAMYLAHTAFGMSLARIGVAMGRDRSTVAHACHAIEDRRDDPSFDAWIARLEQAVRAAPQPPVSVLAEHARRDAA